MRPEPEAARAIPRPLPELDAEREVDFGRYAQRVLARWWLVVAAIAVGALAGYLTSVGGGEVYQAKTTVYLGQPLSPAGGVQIQSLATNPATVSQIVRSESVVQRVAGEVGVDPARLRRGISTKAIVAPGDSARRATQNPLVEISVRGPWRRQSAQAANLLAAAVVQQVSGYVDVKIDALEEQLANQNRELADIDRRLTALEGAIQRGNLSSVERLQLLSLAGFAEQRRGQLLDERTETRQLITLARTVERSTPITEATAQKVPAKSRRSSIVVGALIGLLAGLALALAWERLARLALRRS